MCGVSPLLMKRRSRQRWVNDPEAFCALLAKIIPTKVADENDNPLNLRVMIDRPPKKPESNGLQEPRAKCRLSESFCLATKHRWAICARNGHPGSMVGLTTLVLSDR